MQFRYGLDERPPAGEWILFGLQWLAVTVPIIVIIGKITAGYHFAAAEEETLYMQKLSFVMAVALLAQILAGHRLPLIIGPSTVLLIGIISSGNSGKDAIYTSILLGGGLLSLLSITGLFSHLKRLFTARVVAAVLLLIAFTLIPTIRNLVAPSHGGPGAPSGITFAIALVFVLFLFFRFAKGIWKSTLIIWVMAAGSLAYRILYPDSVPAQSVLHSPALSCFFRHVTHVTVDAGVLISFFFCFLALAVNDMGSIQSTNELLKAPEQGRRLTRGILVTGLSNVLAGLLGVIGPVNFSLSPGVIASTGCASRLALLPTAVLLGLLSFSPAAIGVLGSVPSPVIGGVLLFILCSQVAAGLAILFESPGGFPFESGLILGLPILLGTLVAFLPSDVFNAIPPTLRPILGNGFVVGVAAALTLEHGIFRDGKEGH